MDNGLINIYWYDVLTLINYIVEWLFRLCLLVLLYQAIEYLKWRD